MMKQLMYGSIAIMCLAVAFHLGSVSASSSYVDPSSSGIVCLALDPGNGYNLYIVDQSGSLWMLYGESSWEEVTGFAPTPVPVSQMRFCTPVAIITLDDEIWTRPGMHADSWEYRGAWPGGAVPAERSTWGEVKSRFR